jgi:Tfp pilus assembly protein PilO
MASKSSLSIKPADGVAIIAVLLAVAGLYYIGMPQARKLSDNTAVMKAKQAEADALQERYNILVSLQTTMEQRKSDVDLLLTAYPSEPQMAEALTQAQVIAERSGMTIESLTPSKAKGDGLPVAMTVKGSYQSFDNFAKELRNNLRPILTPGMTVTADRQNGDQLVAQLSNLFAFNIPVEEDTSAAPTATQ